MSEDKDKTKVLTSDPETLNKELEKAKEHDGCFIIIRGPQQGHRFFITQSEMSIGRDPTADISIPEQSISRQHALVKKVDGGIEITDCKSVNGTLINGKKVQPGNTVRLSKEDMIRLGNTIIKYLPPGELEILTYGHLESAAHTDALTKVYNKGYLQEVLEAEFKRAKALNSEFSLAILDLDYFKKINDTYGHDAGDMVLKDFSRLIKTKYLRPKDILARYGGEEFVVVFLNTPAEEAARMAEEIRAVVEAHPFIYENQRLPVTVSIGIAEINSSMESPQTLFKAADRALYVSKNSGRNQVQVAS